MNTNESAVVVSEASMQEWAMLAFHAARAPQRVQVVVKPVAVRDDFVEPAVGGARVGFWVTLAAATAALTLLLV